MNRLKRWLPGLQILKEYQAAWIARDLTAGLVLTTMLVPVGIAYALASGVPGIYGMYATIVPLLAYALFVTSADMLAELEHSLTESGIELRFAEMKDPVKDKLKRFELFERFGATPWTPTSRNTRST